MTKMIAHYDGVYLVAVRGGKGAAHRVTKRKPGSKPRDIKFTGNYMAPDGTTYGVINLSEKKWQAWFKGEEFLPEMETAASAAEKLVKRHKDVYYGCPLCSARFRVKEEADKHIHEHVNKLFEDFRIEVQEDDDAT